MTSKIYALKKKLKRLVSMKTNYPNNFVTPLIEEIINDVETLLKDEISARDKQWKQWSKRTPGLAVDKSS